jgi:hypothetical protein
MDRVRQTKQVCHTADYAAEAAPGKAAQSIRERFPLNVLQPDG